MPGRPGRIVALEGPSGVGKTALARSLAEAPATAARFEEAYARLAPALSLEVPTAAELWRVERRLFSEERERYRSARRTRRSDRLAIVDTGFLGPLTYSVGLAALDPRRDVVNRILGNYRRATRAGSLGAPDLTLYLDAPPAVVARRLARDPVRVPGAIPDRHRRVAGLERRLWLGPIATTWGSRLVVIDARGPAHRVAERARAAIARAARLPRWSDREGATALRAAVEAIAGARPGRRTRPGTTRPSGRGRRRPKEP